VSGRGGAGQWEWLAPWLTTLWWRLLLLVVAVIFAIRNADGTARTLWVAFAGLLFVVGLVLDVRRRDGEA
jgi:hypothetical protein